MKLEKYADGYLLKNTQLELWLNKAGRADKLLYKGQNLIGNLAGNVIDPDRQHSFYLDYHQDLKSTHPQYTELKVLRNNDHFIHLAWIDNKSALILSITLLLIQVIAKSIPMS